ncbi:hypothetical protein GCM10010841_32260 [Deinococcus aerophilus]|uniref:Uncharacterized protein n=1 Tax=Deinococcus aerophilus TaxID=522488 RepID=A0ABQ2H0X7_9DEIO|nr:hypothetical protein GCM10010841_32260 [Deinococcus aerophilus]
MYDVMKEILTGLLGVWILERLPNVAMAIVRFAARRMPTPELREQMHDDWTADIMTSAGPLSAFLTAISIFVSVPSIRAGYGYKPFGLYSEARLLLRAIVLHSYACIGFIVFWLYSILYRYIKLMSVENSIEIDNINKDVRAFWIGIAILILVLIFNFGMHKTMTNLINRRASQ